MSHLTVRQPHSLSTDEARRRLASFEEMLAKYGVKLNWKGDRAEIDGTGVSGGAVVTKSDVTIEIKLGFLARAAGVDADKLRGSVEKRLAAALAGERTA
jgi:putative polyhydroxyalkanoate system protein